MLLVRYVLGGLLLGTTTSCSIVTVQTPDASPREEFASALSRSIADLGDPVVVSYSARISSELDSMASGALRRYGHALSSADTEYVLKVDARGRIEGVFVGTNSKMHTALTEAARTVRLEKPPRAPLYFHCYLNYLAITPGVTGGA